VALIAGSAAVFGAALTVLGNIVVGRMNRATQREQLMAAQLAVSLQDERLLRDKAADRLRTAYRPLLDAIARTRRQSYEFLPFFEQPRAALESPDLVTRYNGQIETLMQEIVGAEAVVGLEPTKGEPSARDVQETLTKFRTALFGQVSDPTKILDILPQLESAVRDHLAQFESPIPAPPA
jgi:hypothetical protein